MRRSTALRTFGAVLGVTMVVAACGQEDTGNGGGDEPAEDSGEPPTIGLVMKSLGNQFFQDMEQGAIEHAEERGDLELVTVGIESETDIEGQVEHVENLISQQVDAIVIAPADSRGLIAPLIRADEAGIEIVNIDVKLDDAALEDAGLEVPFVGPDNVEGAKMVGDVLAEELGPGGKVALLEGVPGAANAEQRSEGFRQAVDEGELELVAAQTAHWETEEANTVFTNILAANPDIQGVMNANDSMALGVVAALESAGRDDIAVVGFDNVPEIQPLVQDGTVLATLDQFGSDQAAFGIDAAMDLLAGEEVEEWQQTPLELITADSF